MDIVTQGIAGAACAQAFCKPQHARPAALVGLGAGLLPDADALIRSASDPLLQLEYHRHFSHALVFIPIGAALVALLLWPFLRQRISPGALYRYALLGYGTGGLLDTCTSYGTHLLWPFSTTPMAWSIIAIVDPIFTLALLVPLLIGLIRKLPMRHGLVLAIAYLIFGAVQHHRAATAAYDLALSRGHVPERLLVKPTVGNLMLWRALYTMGDRVQVDAIRLGEPHRIYPGANLPLFDPASDLPSQQIRNDARRFVTFAQGLAVRYPPDGHFIGDIRYAMLPHNTAPLWGIEYDPTAPQRPAQYVVNRSLNRTLQRQFVAMLLGRDLP